MLLGRGRECGAIDAVLDAARAGSPGVLVLRGPPGIGATALLEWAAGSAPSMQKVALRGSEIESRSPWSGVRQLVAGLPRHLRDLVPEQREILTGGLEASTASDPDGVADAVVALLAAAGRDHPLLVLVDDAHLIDRESHRTLTAAALGIDRGSVAMLVASHDTFDDGWRGLPELVVDGLSPIDAVTLLKGRVDPRVAERLAAMSGGNPLAMSEVATQLSREQRAGSAPLGPVVPLGWALVRHLVRHTDGLSDEQRRLLVLVAASPGLPLATFRNAAAAAGCDPELLDTLVRPGLLRQGPDDRMWFERPLVSDAVYQSVRPEERRAAHRALAAAMTHDGELEARAWHLAAGAGGPDPVAEQALEALAAQAMDHDAMTAGTALARAAELASSRSDSMRHLLAAGQAYSFADMNEPALDSFDRALALTDDATERAAIQVARAGLRLASRSTNLFRELSQMAEQIEVADGGRASSLNAFAALTALAAGELDRSRSLCRRALDLAPADPQRTTDLAKAISALLLMLQGECGEATRQLRDVDVPGDEVWHSGSTLIFEDLIAHALAWVGEVSASSRLVTALVERARRAGTDVLLARALVVRSDLYLRAGYWDTALADANESLHLAAEHDATGPVTLTLAVIARLEAGLGLFAEARRHGFEALAGAEQSELALNAFWAQGALGFLALSEGIGHDAVVHLEAARAFAEREGIDLLVAVPWAPDLVEAYVRVGRVADARRLVSEMEARRAGEQCALAAALMARCSGLVGNGDADSFYREALVAHSDVLGPFERGRTLLSYGEWLRRERRLPDAVPHLEEAASTFNDLGARPWHDRAISELVAHGRRSTNAPRRGMSALTPQEVRVARAVAGGATNREAAAALFLSPRTVEYHLGNVYRKLGVRSRSELTRQMGRGPELVSGTESVSDDA